MSSRKIETVVMLLQLRLEPVSPLSELSCKSNALTIAILARSSHTWPEMHIDGFSLKYRICMRELQLTACLKSSNCKSSQTYGDNHISLFVGHVYA